ncbi:MAG: hypothetical protein ACI84D_002756 [Thalassolituus oleivorans]|jgi:hypothetical protein
MSQLRKAGGLSALVEAACYLLGFAMLVTVFNPADSDAWSQAQKLEFILERKALFQIWIIIIYVVFGVALVVLTAALHQLLNPVAPELMMVATPFGLIWAGLVIASGMVATVGLDMVADTYLQNVDEAVQAWSVISTVQDGLGGGVELVGGLWVLLLSIAGRRGEDGLPKAIVYIGLFVGCAGVLTIVPALGGLGAVFGLSQIVWFVFVGVVLIRQEDAQL